MDNDYQAILQLAFGKMGIKTRAGELLALEFLPADIPARRPEDAFGLEIERQLRAWCTDPDFVFTLPCRAEGSAFQQAVWREISAIPRGETRTYAELAGRLRTSPRAVGNACGRNPLPIIVPCHRIVSRSGLGGFNQGRIDWLLNTKRWLLHHESGAAIFQLA